jgi:hypothetical protein
MTVPVTPAVARQLSRATTMSAQVHRLSPRTLAQRLLTVTAVSIALGFLSAA